MPKNKMKNGVHIIECFDEDDPGSEGRFLKHLFDLMEVSSKHQRVHNVEELLAAMSDSNYKYIHISTHGVLDHSKDFQGWWTRSGRVSMKKVSMLKGKLKCRAVISTACKSAGNGFGRFVVDELGSQYFIGPNKSPSFHSAIFFSHLFYYKLFLAKKTKTSVRKSFASFKARYRNPSGFRLFR